MRSRVSALEPQQLEVVKDLDAKFEGIMKQLDINPIPLDEKEKVDGLLNYYMRTLQVYNAMFNKYIINGDFFEFKIENILKYELGENMI